MFYVVVAIAGFVFLAMSLSLPEKRAEHNPPFDFFGWTALSLGMIGLQMLLDRGERLEWFNSAEIWAEAIASVLGVYLYFVHVLTAKAHFLDMALFKDRNFVLSAIMYFAFGFVLLPTIALTSPMLDEILRYPADTTGYMAIPRSVALVGAMILAARAVPVRVDNRLFLAAGMALVVYANWRMLGYSPAMDWRYVVVAGMLQGAGLSLLLLDAHQDSLQHTRSHIPPRRHCALQSVTPLWQLDRRRVGPCVLLRQYPGHACEKLA